MKKNKKLAISTGVIGIIIILVLGIILIMPQPYSDKMPPPFQLTLSFSEKPLLNTPVSLNLQVLPLSNSSNTSVTFELPGSFEVIYGNLSWKGNCTAHEMYTFNVIVQSTKVGYYKIKSIVQGNLLYGGRSVQGARTDLYLEVTPDDVLYGSTPENHWYRPAEAIGFGSGIYTNISENNLTVQSNSDIPNQFLVTYTVTVPITVLKAQISIVFPPLCTYEVISDEIYINGTLSQQATGHLNWEGIYYANQTIELRGRIRVTNTGSGLVQGFLFGQPAGENYSATVAATSIGLYVDKYMIP